MAQSKAAPGRAPAMTIDEKLVRQLADILADTGLTEIEIQEGEKRVRVSRAAPAAAPAPVAAAAAAPAPAPAQPAPAAAPAPEAPAANALKSPMVGTVYLAAEPGAKPFVSAGTNVKEGETLLIVEAMKVMNPISAPRAGTVREVLVADGPPVEFDQPLVIIE